MTKEECIGLLKRYAEYNGMGIPNLAGCREAMRMAAELLERPSLPSVLDEAAEFDKMFEDFCDRHPNGLTLNECAEFFYDKGEQTGAEWQYQKDRAEFAKLKAKEWQEGYDEGAKWQAEQFVLVGGEPTGWFRTNDGSEYATGLDLKEPIKLPVDFYVRKK